MSLFSWLHKRLTSRPQTRRSSTRKPTLRFRPQLESLEGRIVPSTVTSIADSGPGSLRAAITTANPGDTINFNFAPSTTPQTITLTSGELVLNKSLTIQGLGAGELAISGGNTSRVFEVYGVNTNVTLSGLTITQGNAYATNNHSNFDGGGILNEDGSTLTISDCTVSNNRATLDGGGIANSVATLQIVNSTLSGNRVMNSNGDGDGEGGGVYSIAGSTVSMIGCTLSNNVAGSEGGGIYIYSTTMKISGCTLSGNISLGGYPTVPSGPATTSTTPTPAPTR